MLGIHRPFRLAALLILAVTSGLVYLANQPPDESRKPRAALAMGYYVKQARLRGTDVDGHVLYRVRADSAQQNLADGSITLDTVDVDYEPVADIPWHLSATHGQIPPDRNIIRLSGDVVASTRTPAEPPTLIRTDYLELDPEAFVASTQRGVVVERLRDTLHARGMRVYLKQDRVQLESEVRGKFLP